MLIFFSLLTNTIAVYDEWESRGREPGDVKEKIKEVLNKRIFTQDVSVKM